MTHPTYTQQALCCYTLPRLKRIATELGVTPTGDKRGAETWINAIITHQSTQIQKAQAIAPEKLTTVEISFYDHEFYAASKLIASITHDEDLTQPWLVMVNGAEKFRANTWARCHRFIQWHLNNSQLPSRNSQLNSISKSREFASLMNQSPHHIDNCELRIANCELLDEPVPAQTEVPCPTENRIMAQIFNECEKYGFEILDDGIYTSNCKLGEVGHTNAGWWFTRAADATQQRIPCDKNSFQFAIRNSQLELALLAKTYKLSNHPVGIWHILIIANCELVIANCFVYWLSMVDTMPHPEVADYEEMLDRPFEMLTNEEWGQLRQLVTA